MLTFAKHALSLNIRISDLSTHWLWSIYHLEYCFGSKRNRRSFMHNFHLNVSFRQMQPLMWTVAHSLFIRLPATPCVWDQFLQTQYYRFQSCSASQVFLFSQGTKGSRHRVAKDRRINTIVKWERVRVFSFDLNLSSQRPWSQVEKSRDR